MKYIVFQISSIVSAALLIVGLISIYYKKHKAGDFFLSLGILVQAIFISWLWITIDRPPMRTLGETRMWYAFFMLMIGFVAYKKYRYIWLIFYSVFMSLLFTALNYFKPENFDKTLMPALQSIWFVPHVLVYIFAYALLAASTIVALKALYVSFFRNESDDQLLPLMLMADSLVYLGFSFLSLGLIFGALWAKEAWGHYWTWDPKETWAFITWLAYLIYIHLRISRPKNILAALWMLALAFVFLLVAWMGINYLPSAQNSVHVYGAN